MSWQPEASPCQFFINFNSASFALDRSYFDLVNITMPIILICTYVPYWMRQYIHWHSFLMLGTLMYKTYISKWCSKCSSCPPSSSRDMSSKRPPPSFMTCQRSTGEKEPALTWPQFLSIEDMGQLGVDFCSKIVLKVS